MEHPNAEEHDHPAEPEFDQPDVPDGDTNDVPGIGHPDTTTEAKGVVQT